MSTSPAPQPSSTEPSPIAPLPDGELDAMQAALAGEHAGVYGYGVVGAHLEDDARDSAREALAVHRSRRNTLEVDIRALGAQPVAALPGYALPFPVTDESSARRLAGTMEQRLQPLYVDLVTTATDTAAREFAARAVADAAVRAAIWTAATVAFPGLDGRADAATTPGGTPSATAAGPPTPAS
jgi:hypothetical protein